MILTLLGGPGHLLADLVADAPDNHTRMVAVTLYPVGQIARIPFVKEGTVTGPVLAAAPFVESLVQDQQAHFVAKVQQFRCRDIMRSTDGIETRRLQDFQLTLQGATVYSRTDAAQIMMLAGTVQLDGAAIQEETLVHVPFRLPDTDAGLDPVHDLVPRLQLGFHRI